jgi:hypothetical protein
MKRFDTIAPVRTGPAATNDRIGTASPLHRKKHGFSSIGTLRLSMTTAGIRVTHYSGTFDAPWVNERESPPD